MIMFFFFFFCRYARCKRARCRKSVRRSLRKSKCRRVGRISRNVRDLGRKIANVFTNVVRVNTLVAVCKDLHQARRRCSSSRCRSRITLQIHSRCSKSCAKLRARLTVCATKRGEGKKKCLRHALKRLRRRSCDVLGVNEAAKRPVGVAPVVRHNLVSLFFFFFFFFFWLFN
jgi:hypothetical protein